MAPARLCALLAPSDICSPAGVRSTPPDVLIGRIETPARAGRVQLRVLRIVEEDVALCAALQQTLTTVEHSIEFCNTGAAGGIERSTRTNTAAVDRDRSGCRFPARGE